jgi:hypothetical protein
MVTDRAVMGDPVDSSPTIKVSINSDIFVYTAIELYDSLGEFMP